ncbi:ABC transporter permease [Nocardiopsis coralliicola]
MTGLDGPGGALAPAGQTDSAADGAAEMESPVTTATAPATAADPSGAAKALRDTWLVFRRQMLPSIRNPVFVIVFGMLQPVMYLVFFGPLLSGMPGPLGADPMQWFVPGMLCMLGIFGTAFAGFGMIPEMHSGVHERLLAAPVSRTALLLGRVLRDVTVLIAQALLVVAGAAVLGVEVSPTGVAIGMVLLAVLGTGLGTFSYLLAMALKVPFKFSSVLQATILPLTLLSGVMLPMDLAPAWLYTLSRFNPISYVVDAERSLFNGGIAVPEVALGALAAFAVAALALGLGARSMRRLST